VGPDFKNAVTEILVAIKQMFKLLNSFVFPSRKTSMINWCRRNKPHRRYRYKSIIISLQAIKHDDSAFCNKYQAKQEKKNHSLRSLSDSHPAKNIYNDQAVPYHKEAAQQ